MEIVLLATTAQVQIQVLVVTLVQTWRDRETWQPMAVSYARLASGALLVSMLVAPAWRELIVMQEASNSQASATLVPTGTCVRPKACSLQIWCLALRTISVSLGSRTLASTNKTVQRANTVRLVAWKPCLALGERTTISCASMSASHAPSATIAPSCMM